MATPSTTITKNIALAPDGWKRTAFPDGSVPNAGPSAPPTFTTSKTSSSITANIIDANGATSFRVRVNAGTAEDGQTKTGLTAETAYSFQVQGVNEFGASDWSTAVNVTTSAASGTSGGTSALSWQAPDGLADQNELILQTNTHTFTAPEKLVWLGFGEGWLYSQADGTALAQSIDVNGQWLVYEDGAGNERRFVQTVGGVKVLLTTAYPGGNSALVAGGMINWDTGSEIGNDSNIFMFSRSRCSDGTVANADFQWKQDRVRHSANLSGLSRNSVYVTETSPLGSGRRLIAYDSGGTPRALYTPVPRHGDGWHSFGWSWKPNTPDAADGAVGVFNLQDGSTGISVDHAPSGSPGIEDLITSGGTERPRWVMVQDYIGNNTNNTQDIVIERTDIYWQRGGTLFFLADNANPAMVTKITPLRVNAVTAGNSVSLKLWKGNMADYSAKAVLVYDPLLNFIDSVELI